VLCVTHVGEQPNTHFAALAAKYSSRVLFKTILNMRMYGNITEKSIMDRKRNDVRRRVLGSDISDD
jgi:hypothetical protein